jgi:hypothetical protein
MGTATIRQNIHVKLEKDMLISRNKLAEPSSLAYPWNQGSGQIGFAAEVLKKLSEIGIGEVLTSVRFFEVVIASERARFRLGYQKDKP